MNHYILQIQKELIRYGYNPGVADGIAGPKTLEALKNALSLTGVTPKPTPAPKYKLSARSESRMAGVHKDLVKVVRRAIEITDVDFTVGEGLRTAARQRQLVAQGASKTMNSRHLTGHAVDLIALDDDGKVSWSWPLYHRIAAAMKQAAAEVGVPIEAGADWKTFPDGPHFQLPWKNYPR